MISSEGCGWLVGIKTDLNERIPVIVEQWRGGVKRHGMHYTVNGVVALYRWDKLVPIEIQVFSYLSY